MRSFAVLLVIAAVCFANEASETIRTQVPGNGYTSISGSIWEGPMAVLFDNGPFVNNPGGGVGGADESVMASGESTYGFSCAVALPAMVADDFVIPSGETWNITGITFFAYQTNSGTGSTINWVALEIFDDPPTSGTSVYGSTSTNYMTGTSWSNCYRVTSTESGSGTARPVMANVTTTGSCVLGEGTYWLVWQVGGTSSSGPWANPITITGQPVTGNAQQWYQAVWNPLVMGGTGAAQGLPFIIEGDLTALERSTWAEIKTLF